MQKYLLLRVFEGKSIHLVNFLLHHYKCVELAVSPSLSIRPPFHLFFPSHSPRNLPHFPLYLFPSPFLV